MNFSNIEDIVNSFTKNDKKNLYKLDFVKKYLRNGSNFYIHKKTGLVRSDLYPDSLDLLEKFWNNNYNKQKPKYNSRLPFVLGRYMYVLATIENFFNLKKKINLCDFSASNGSFLNLVKTNSNKFNLFAVEDNKNNCKILKTITKNVIQSSLGILIKKNSFFKEKIKVGTLLWTLSCCVKPLDVMRDIYDEIEDGGYVVVAESSRILVPYKKKLSAIFNKKEPADIHPFWYSKNTLESLLYVSGFKTVYVNRFEDSDVLLIIGKKIKRLKKKKIQVDNFYKVLNFMKNWEKNI